MTIQQLREKRAEHARQARNLLDQNPGDKWNKDLQAQYDGHLAEIDRADAEIKRHQDILDRDADNAFRNMGGREIDLGGQQSGNSEARKLHAKWLRGGDRALSADEWAAIRNTMSTGTGSEGGYTVQTEVAKTVIESLKAFGGMREVAEVIRTAQGNPMNFPTTDGTAEEGELVPENQSAADQDVSFGTVGLNVFKFSSKVVTVPIELLQDSEVNIEALVNNRLGTRLGRITNKKFTIGTGTAEPRGIVTGAGAGKVGTTGQTTTIIYDDLVDLEHSVDPAYRIGARWMASDAMIKTLKKLKDDQNRPLWVPGVSVKEPDTINGYPYTINQDVPVPAANAKSLLFGKMDAYKIRDVMLVTLFRFTDSAFAKKGQVGFLAWIRSGGNLTDAAAVRYYQHAAT